MAKEIPLTKGFVAIVDDEDFEWLSQYSWYAHRSRSAWYARAQVNGKKVRMHRLIMNAPRGKEVDHINHNTLDNQRHNLRVVTPRKNKENRRPYGTCEPMAAAVAAYA